MQLHYTTPWEKMRLIDEKPVHSTFDRPEARLIAPGDPARSVLLHRLSVRGPNSGQMPPLSTHRVDQAGVELLTEWCRRLKK
jgi:hypothetical protein